MAAFLLIPLSIAAGMIAGAITGRRAVRAEMDELRALIRGSNGHAPEPPLIPLAAPLEAAGEKQAPVQPEVAPAAREAKEISPEILMVLTAAVAAFLGKKARIRRASAMPSMGANSWAQQGRVFVQASHNLPLQHR
jgi:methylmalonyl-CoA carboxyltransferase large subunit